MDASLSRPVDASSVLKEFMFESVEKKNPFALVGGKGMFCKGI